MTDLAQRLRDHASSDHTRGCQGRCYSCECGYDDKTEPLLVEAAAEIERLRAALKPFADAVDEHLETTPDSQELDGSLTIGHLREARRVLHGEQ